MEEEVGCAGNTEENDVISFTFPQSRPLFSRYRVTNMLACQRSRVQKHCTPALKSDSNVRSEDHEKEEMHNDSVESRNNIVKNGPHFYNLEHTPYANRNDHHEMKQTQMQTDEEESNEKIKYPLNFPKTPLVKRVSKENVHTPYEKSDENMFSNNKTVKNVQVPSDCEKVHQSSGRVLQNILNYNREPRKIPESNESKPNPITQVDDDHQKESDLKRNILLHPIQLKAVQVTNSQHEIQVNHNIFKTSEKCAAISNSNKMYNCTKELFVTPSVNPNQNALATKVEKLEIEGGKRIKENAYQRPTSSKVVKNVHYTILSKIGQGGSSKVYQVLDDSSHLFAMKCVSLADTEPTIADGYLKEIELLAQLQKSNRVIKLIDFEHLVSEQTLYVIMEKGDTDLSSLLKHIAKTKDISMPMIIYYWTEMLLAVKEIHDCGIVHADLKPANFLLVNGRLKLIDFGIASSLQNDVTSVVKNSMHGTWNYMSPEAIQDPGDASRTKVGYKSDVWSLGCILYNLLYGKTPFQHLSHNYIKLQTITNPRHQIDFPHLDSCPPVLMEAVQRCLKYDSKQRPSVGELLTMPYICTAKH